MYTPYVSHKANGSDLYQACGAAAQGQLGQLSPVLGARVGLELPRVQKATAALRVGKGRRRRVRKEEAVCPVDVVSYSQVKLS